MAADADSELFPLSLKTVNQPPAFDPDRVRAITLDLDDTLWPIWPTIARAEGALQQWLADNAPATAAMT